MRRIIPFLIIALTAGAAGAQTYKWVDERGVTTYGTKPPAGRPAQRVETPLAGTIETGDSQLKRYEAEQNRRAEAWQPPPAPPVSAVSTPSVRGMPFDTYVRLQAGMTEGELLLRAGAPDYVSAGNVGGYFARSFYYYPTASDPFITAVMVRGGRIADIQRTRKF